MLLCSRIKVVARLNYGQKEGRLLSLPEIHPAIISFPEVQAGNRKKDNKCRNCSLR
jgi:hypothetical protein